MQRTKVDGSAAGVGGEFARIELVHAVRGRRERGVAMVAELRLVGIDPARAVEVCADGGPAAERIERLLLASLQLRHRGTRKPTRPHAAARVDESVESVVGVHVRERL